MAIGFGGSRLEWVHHNESPAYVRTTHLIPSTTLHHKIEPMVAVRSPPIARAPMALWRDYPRCRHSNADDFATKEMLHNDRLSYRLRLTGVRGDTDADEYIDVNIKVLRADGNPLGGGTKKGTTFHPTGKTFQMRRVAPHTYLSCYLRVHTDYITNNRFRESDVNALEHTIYVLPEGERVNNHKFLNKRIVAQVAGGPNLTVRVRPQTQDHPIAMSSQKFAIDTQLVMIQRYKNQADFDRYRPPRKIVQSDTKRANTMFQKINQYWARAGYEAQAIGGVPVVNMRPPSENTLVFGEWTGRANPSAFQLQLNIVEKAHTTGVDASAARSLLFNFPAGQTPHQLCQAFRAQAANMGMGVEIHFLRPRRLILSEAAWLPIGTEGPCDIVLRPEGFNEEISVHNQNRIHIRGVVTCRAPGTRPCAPVDKLTNIDIFAPAISLDSHGGETTYLTDGSTNPRHAVVRMYARHYFSADRMQVIMPATGARRPGHYTEHIRAATSPFDMANCTRVLEQCVGEYWKTPAGGQAYRHDPINPPYLKGAVNLGVGNINSVKNDAAHEVGHLLLGLNHCGLMTSLPEPRWYYDTELMRNQGPEPENVLQISGNLHPVHHFETVWDGMEPKVPIPSLFPHGNIVRAAERLRKGEFADLPYVNPVDF